MGFAGHVLSAVSTALLRLALPGLCVVSGWCFFRDASPVEIYKWYFPKLRRRVSGLLVPYFAWGAVFTLAYVLLKDFSPRVAERLEWYGVDSVSGYFRAVFDLKGAVLYGPLWFLRAIFACAAISPAYALALAFSRRAARFAGVVVVGLCAGWMMQYLDFRQYDTYVFVCFGIGAFAARDLPGLFKRRAGFLPFARPAGFGFFLYIIHLFVNRVFEWSFAPLAAGNAVCVVAFYFATIAISTLAPLLAYICCLRVFHLRPSALFARIKANGND